MTTKLTLSVEKEVIKKAKLFAKRSNRSLSEIVSTFLERITEQEDLVQKDNDLDKLVGIISLPTDFDEKKMVRELRIEKHG